MSVSRLSFLVSRSVLKALALGAERETRNEKRQTFLKSPGQLCVCGSLWFTRDHRPDTRKLRMTAIQQILPSKAEFETFCWSPPQASINPRVARRLLIRQAGYVIERSIRFEVSREREKRMKLDLVPGAVAFGMFRNRITAGCIRAQLHPQ